MIAATLLRSGNAGSARGAASMIAEAITTARRAARRVPIVVRADSAFYTKTVITACRRRDVRFSVTTRIDAMIRTASKHPRRASGSTSCTPGRLDVDTGR